MQGWLKLHRQAVDSQYFSMGLKHIGMFKVLLLKTNWKPGYFMGEKIMPGSFGTSISKLADILSEDRRVIRKILDDLESYGMITRKSVANRWTHITICNWETYQQSDDEVLPTDAQQVDQPSDQPIPTIEEGKKGKKERKEDPDFESFWNIYQKKSEKKQALAQWKNLSAGNKAKALEVAPVYVASTPDPRYRKSAWRWLKDERFNDEIEPEPNPQDFFSEGELSQDKLHLLLPEEEEPF